MTSFLLLNCHIVELLETILLTLSLVCSLFQELPLLFLKGGAIVPTGPVIQHAGDAKPTDTLTLLIALDDQGKPPQF